MEIQKVVMVQPHLLQAHQSPTQVVAVEVLLLVIQTLAEQAVVVLEHKVVVASQELQI
jgi:hypothetical protein